MARRTALSLLNLPAGAGVRRFVMVRLGVSTAVLGSIVCADGPIGISESTMGGALSLRAYDGLPLPVDLGPLGSRSGGVSDCHHHVDNGFLILEPDYGVFDLAFEVHRCDGLVLSRPNDTGVYWIEGDRWIFLVPAVAEGVPDDFQFRGSLDGGSLLVTGFASVPLEFSGEFVAHAPRQRRVGGPEKPLGAAYALIEPKGGPAECVKGFLILEPDYRVFEMGFEPSCLEPRERWFGVYGQSGDQLELLAPSIAEDGGDVLFFGRISAGAIRLVDPLGRELVFANTGIISEW